MKGILYARVLRMKKDWKSLIFWLVFPLLLTIITTKLVGVWGEDTKIPIGLVISEESSFSNQLLEQLNGVSYIDIRLLDEREAINQLEKHELDSVFILNRRYEQMLMDGKRNQLIEAYSSNRSYTYFAVKELVTSFVQDDVSRMKAVYEVKDLFKEYKADEEWNWEEIVQASIEKQQSQNLLQTSFSYPFESAKQEDNVVGPIFNIWGIWAFFDLISTFFLFDWVLKEKRAELHVRWLFTSTTFKSFASMGLVFYTVTIIFVDIISLFILSEVLQEPSRSLDFWISFLFFKLVVHLLAFLVVNLFRHPLMYYVSSFSLALIMLLLSGAIIPINSFSNELGWVPYLSPVTSFLNGQIPYGWFAVLLLWFIIWYKKGDEHNA